MCLYPIMGFTDALVVTYHLMISSAILVIAQNAVMEKLAYGNML